jgi:hypothetical protein
LGTAATVTSAIATSVTAGLLGGSMLSKIASKSAETLSCTSMISWPGAPRAGRGLAAALAITRGQVAFVAEAAARHGV